MSSTNNRISDVIPLCAYVVVTILHTHTYVACMTYLLPCWDRPMPGLPRFTVYRSRTWRARTISYDAITTAIERPKQVSIEGIQRGPDGRISGGTVVPTVVH